jgi:hypothetical protein
MARSSAELGRQKSMVWRGYPLYLGSEAHCEMRVSEERWPSLWSNAQPANGLCVFHDPTRATEGRRARHAGGINRSRSAATLPFDARDHALGTTKDVSTLLADSINQLRRGQLDPRVANAMGYLATVLLRALEQGPLEERLTKIEEMLG